MRALVGGAAVRGVALSESSNTKRPGDGSLRAACLRQQNTELPGHQVDAFGVWGLGVCSPAGPTLIMTVFEAQTCGLSV